MQHTVIRSPYWDSRSAAETRRRISEYEKEKTHRPTVVVPIVDYVGRPLVVKHATTGTWGLIQGHIEPSDKHPLAAGLREAYEEGTVIPGAVEGMFPYLGERGLEFTGPQSFFTGYSKGGYYVFVGLKLRAGADVSVIPAPGEPPALLERRWCSSLSQAIGILHEQPGVQSVSRQLQNKIETVLIPAIESIYQPESSAFLELLDQLG